MCAVNNAGFVLGVDHIGNIADANFEEMFNVNVLGLIRVTQLFVNGRRSDACTVGKTCVF